MLFTRKDNSGFTLIELSIVLVIIGLIVGGVLVGKDLIRAAQLRSVLEDKDKITAAVYTFKLKYNCIAGDCPTATNFFGTDANCPNTASNTITKIETCNGTGNYKINDQADVSQLYEMFRFWQHLAAANLIEGAFTGTRGSASIRDCQLTVHCKESKAGGRYAVQYIDVDGTAAAWFPMPAGHYLKYGGPKTAGSVGWLEKEVLTPAEAQSLDEKADNGKPGTGSVITYDTGAAGTVGDCATTSDPSTAIYDTTVEDISCILHFRMGNGTF